MNQLISSDMVNRGVTPSFSALTESQGEVISPMRSQLQRTGMTDVFADDSFRQGLQDTAQNRMNQRVSADVGQDIISRAFQANEAARRRKFGREQNQLNRDYRGSESALDQAFRGDQAQLGREYRGGEAALDRDYRESELIKGIDFRGSESDLQRQYGLGQEDRRISDVQGREKRQQEMEDYAIQSDLFRSGAIDELGEGASSAIFGDAGVRTEIEQDLIQRARNMGVDPEELQEAKRGITDVMAKSVAYDPSQYTMSPKKMMEREEQMAKIAAHLPYEMTGVLSDSKTINPETGIPYENTTDIWNQNIMSTASDMEYQKREEEKRIRKGKEEGAKKSAYDKTPEGIKANEAKKEKYDKEAEERQKAKKKKSYEKSLTSTVVSGAENNKLINKYGQGWTKNKAYISDRKNGKTGISRWDKLAKEENLTDIEKMIRSTRKTGRIQ